MSQLNQQLTDEQKICIQLEDARLAVDVSLRELTKNIDERNALRAELSAVLSRRVDIDLTIYEDAVDEFIVPWGYCEDDDAA